jgi:hypothetical protein
MATLRVGSLDLGKIVVAFCLTFAVADWFSAIRAPLWLDETNSYWSIAGGFWRIWSRQGLSFPAYSYILWLTARLFGSSEVVLRLPSVAAMLAAVYVLYRIAREFFEADIAWIVTLIFCVQPAVSFAAVDARPYACGVLVTNCAILMLLRFIKTNARRDAVLFGVYTAGIFYFHYLFGVVVAAFLLVVFVRSGREWKRVCSKLAVALVPFALMMLVAFSHLVYLVETRQSHVYTLAPTPDEFLQTVIPANLGVVFLAAVVAATVIGRLRTPEGEPSKTAETCLILGIVPLGILYSVSVFTPIHVFLPRYRLVALSGVALCWGFLISRIGARSLRIALCVALMLCTFHELPCSIWRDHGYSWKEALQVADANVASDHAPLLIASGLVESNSAPLPTDVINSPMFSPLSYYKVHGPVVALPRDLTPAAQAQVNKFLSNAVPARQRFVVLVHGGVEHNLNVWIENAAQDYYTANVVGAFDDVVVTEYVPRDGSPLRFVPRSE